MKTTTRSAIRSAAVSFSRDENDGMDFAAINQEIDNNLLDKALCAAEAAYRDIAGNLDYDNTCLGWLILNQHWLPKQDKEKTGFRPASRAAARQALNMGIHPSIVECFFSEVQYKESDMTLSNILGHYVYGN